MRAAALAGQATSARSHPRVVARGQAVAWGVTSSGTAGGAPVPRLSLMNRSHETIVRAARHVPSDATAHGGVGTDVGRWRVFGTVDGAAPAVLLVERPRDRTGRQHEAFAACRSARKACGASGASPALAGRTEATTAMEVSSQSGRTSCVAGWSGKGERRRVRARPAGRLGRVYMEVPPG